MAVFVETVNGHQLAAAIKGLHRLKPENVLHAIGLVSTLVCVMQSFRAS
jgi:hypothetical protein